MLLSGRWIDLFWSRWYEYAIDLSRPKGFLEINADHLPLWLTIVRVEILNVLVYTFLQQRCNDATVYLYSPVSIEHHIERGIMILPRRASLPCRSPERKPTL